MKTISQQSQNPLSHERPISRSPREPSFCVAVMQLRGGAKRLRFTASETTACTVGELCDRIASEVDNVDRVQLLFANGELLAPEAAVSSFDLCRVDKQPRLLVAMPIVHVERWGSREIASGGQARVIAAHLSSGVTCAAKIMHNARPAGHWLPPELEFSLATLSRCPDMSEHLMLPFSFLLTTTTDRHGRTVERDVLLMPLAPGVDALTLAQRTSAGREPAHRVHDDDYTLMGVRNAMAGCHAQLVTSRQLERLGWCHGDHKPENLLLMGQEADGRARFQTCDVGLACQTGLTTSRRGTTSFSAPETQSGVAFRQEVADLWSAGASAHVLLFGTHAPRGSSWREQLEGTVQRRVPLVLQEAVLGLLGKLLEPNPATREFHWTTEDLVQQAAELAATPEQDEERSQASDDSD